MMFGGAYQRAIVPIQNLRMVLSTFLIDLPLSVVKEW